MSRLEELRKFTDNLLWVNSFVSEPDKLKIEAILSDKNLDNPTVRIDFSEVIFFSYTTYEKEDPEGFDIIDAFVETVITSKYIFGFENFPQYHDYFVLRFHSGTHHLVTSFKAFSLSYL